MDSLQYFPQEIIQQILLKLPFKQLFSDCTIVCKEWRSLILSNRFLSVYLRMRFYNFPLIAGSELSVGLIKLSSLIAQKYSLFEQVPLASYKASSTCNIHTHHVYAITNCQHSFWMSDPSPVPKSEYICIGLGVYEMMILQSIHIRFATQNKWEDGEAKSKVINSSEMVKICVHDERGKIIYTQRERVAHTEILQTIMLKRPLFLNRRNLIFIHFDGKIPTYKTYLENSDMYQSSVHITALGIALPFRFVEDEIKVLTEEEKAHLARILQFSWDQLDKAVFHNNEEGHIIGSMNDEDEQIYAKHLSQLALLTGIPLNYLLLDDAQERFDDHHFGLLSDDDEESEDGQDQGDAASIDQDP